MPPPFSDASAFRRDPLALLLDRAAATDHHSPFAPLFLGVKPVWLVVDPDLARAASHWPAAPASRGRLIRGIAAPAADQAEQTVPQSLRGAASVRRIMAIVNQFVARIMVDGRLDTESDLPPLAFELACLGQFGEDATSAADRILLVEAARAVEAPARMRLTRPDSSRGPADEKRAAEQFFAARATARQLLRRIAAKSQNFGLFRGLGADRILARLSAGSRAAAATMGWLVHHLAEQPGLAAMIAIEADDLLDSLETSDATRLGQASLSMAFVGEILRLYPPVWRSLRAAPAPVELGGRRFAAGDRLMIAPWQLHRDGRLWSRPDELRLDRALTGPAYLPFGAEAGAGMGLVWSSLQLFALQVASALRFSRVTAGAPKPKPSITLLFPPSRYAVFARDCVAPLRARA